MEVSSFKVFSNVLGKEGERKFLQNLILGRHVYYEGVDNIKNMTKMDSYHANFGPP